MRLIIVGVLRALGKKNENYIILYGVIAKTRKNDMTYDMKIHVYIFKPQGNNHTKTVLQAIVQIELGLYIFQPKKLNSTPQYAACAFNENSISREKTNTA